MLALLQAAPADQLSSLNSQVLDFVKLVLVLGAILILAFLTLRYWLPGFMGTRQPATGPIQVVARFPLEPRKHLYIIRVGGDFFLMGTSETEMYHFTSLDPATVEPYLQGAAQSPGPDFGSLLKKLRGRKDGES